MSRAKSDLGNFFDYGLDVASRTIYIGSYGETSDEPGCDYNMAGRAIMALHVLDRTTGDITIKMNNIGGDEYHGLAIYDAIKACENPVRLVGMGCVMSMGAWIMQAADERVMTPNATMMIHYGVWSYEGHTFDYLKWAAEVNRINKLMEDHFLARIREKHPKYSAAKFRHKFLFDSFLSAQEALDLGLIDAILENK